jgi:hypothetical protein
VRTGDECHQILEERLALMLLVVTTGQTDVDLAQLGRDKSQAFAFEAGEDLTGQSAFDGVRLADDEGAVHEGLRLVLIREYL